MIFMEFTAFSTVYAAAIAVSAFATVFLLEKILGPTVVVHRISALDGLRGFLVIGVFIHHAANWYMNIKTGAWHNAPSKFYSNLGPACVALFFMITAFLFYGKILRNGGQQLDWLQIALSRILRLVPLYIVMVFLIFCVALTITDFTLVESPIMLAKKFLMWAPAGLGTSENINGLENSWKINSGVQWTLAYEWLFYLSLPTLALFAKFKPKWSIVLISLILASAVAWRIFPMEKGPTFSFLGGIIGAYAIHNSRVVKLCRESFSSIIALACSAAVLFYVENPFSGKGLVLLTAVFVIVACGNSIFGLLTLKSIRSLGDMGYSVYLLHGIVLYVAFQGQVGISSALVQHPVDYWMAVVGLTVPLVIICRFTFAYVELPAMNAAPRVYKFLKNTRFAASTSSR